MSRKKSSPLHLPKQGERAPVHFLAREVKRGWRDDSPVGTLLEGWCTASDSRQLWRTVTTGPDAEAVFEGFVCRDWDGGPGL